MHVTSAQAWERYIGSAMNSSSHEHCHTGPENPSAELSEVDVGSISPLQRMLQDILIIVVGLALAGIPIAIGSMQLSGRAVRAAHIGSDSRIVALRGLASVPVSTHVQRAADRMPSLEIGGPAGGSQVKAVTRTPGTE